MHNTCQNGRPARLRESPPNAAARSERFGVPGSSSGIGVAAGGPGSHSGLSSPGGSAIGGADGVNIPLSWTAGRN